MLKRLRAKAPKLHEIEVAMSIMALILYTYQRGSQSVGYLMSPVAFVYLSARQSINLVYMVHEKVPCANI